MNQRPLIALAIGDAAGIGPELVAKVLAEPELPDADILVVGDPRVFGTLPASVPAPDLPRLDPGAPRWPDGTAAILDLAHHDAATPIGRASRQGGAFALANFDAALALAAAGVVDAVAFAPFNKEAMRLAEPRYVDEIAHVQRRLDADVEGAEFNVLDEVWNARVTSHVPLAEVAGLITGERIGRAIRLTDATMRGTGHEAPRIAVAALNPHAGDGGNFGTEEIEVIGPAVEAARAEGYAVAGPIPSDTVYVRALKGEFDAVLTMYHDQGQVAVKLIGFDRGVTLIGGFPFPITTPAHGTAYDIAGRGVASTGAMRRALQLAHRLVLHATPTVPPREPRLARLAQALDGALVPASA